MTRRIELTMWWNPVKELKAYSLSAVTFVAFAPVESGEGIESYHIASLPIAILPLVESGEGIERRTVNRLHLDARKLVESGEGIESSRNRVPLAPEGCSGIR